MGSCDTLEDAIRALKDHLQIVDRGTLVQIEKADDAVVLSCLQYGSAGRGGGIIVESLLATICTALRELCGRDWFPAEVHLARRVPEDSSAFRSFFRAPIRFNQDLTAITADQCPRISAEHLAAERIRLGDALYRQEYFGAFVSAPGSVFDAEVLAHMFGDHTEEEPDELAAIVQGRSVDRFLQ